MWETPGLLSVLTGINYVQPVGSSPDCIVFIPIEITIPTSHLTFLTDAKSFQGS